MNYGKLNTHLKTCVPQEQVNSNTRLALNLLSNFSFAAHQSVMCNVKLGTTAERNTDQSDEDSCLLSVQHHAMHEPDKVTKQLWSLLGSFTSWWFRHFESPSGITFPECTRYMGSHALLWIKSLIIQYTYVHKYVHNATVCIKRVCTCGNFKRKQQPSYSSMICRAGRETRTGMPREKHATQSLESSISVFFTLRSKEAITKANYPKNNNYVTKLTEYSNSLHSLLVKSYSAQVVLQ